MRNLIIGLDVLDENNKILDEFIKEFKVDLTSEKYKEGTIKNKWTRLVQDCTLGKSRENFFEYFYLFEQKLLNLIMGNRSSAIIRTSDYEDKQRRQTIINFRKFTEECTALLDNYNIYEADVWMNVWLTLEYRKSEKRRVDDKNNKRYNPKNLLGAVSSKDGYVYGKGDNKYLLPFKEGTDGYFCNGYLKCVLGNAGNIFWTEQENEKVNINKYEYIDTELRPDRDYSRYDYRKIKKLENRKDYKLEDKILFHKTIHGFLIRNLINIMIKHGKSTPIEECAKSIEPLCGCSSLIWQNLIACFGILIMMYEQELDAAGVYADARLILHAWQLSIEKINYNLHLLIKGMLYLYEGTEQEDDLIERECRQCIPGLELENNETIDKYWESVSKTKKLRASVKNSPEGYEWTYAILQRGIIHMTKKLYADNQFEKDVSKITEEVKEGKIYITKAVDLQPDLLKAKDRLKTMMEMNKRNRLS